jgi:gamma-glutamylcyclotransferase (GGCT)/AIG2-like uncharacterized protein YtfP
MSRGGSHSAATSLFVYGTLAPGRPNEHVLAPLRGRWQRGTVTGTLYQEGWGAAAGYPGIVLDGATTEVHGLLFTSEELPEHWSRLDAFEGEGYRRVATAVHLEDGTAVDAFLYELAPGARCPREG